MSTVAEGAPPRRNSSSTRAFHMRRILRGRAAGYGLGLGIIAAFMAGAWLRSPLVMALGPAAVAALAAGVAFALATRRAERDFFLSFAAARGMRYVGDTTLLPLTPLLGAGDQRGCSHWIVFLARRRGLAGLLGEGWLDTRRRRKVELESLRLH